MPGEAEELTCARCGLVVRVNRDSCEIFEGMHYVCFHHEFEHGGFDPDEECDAGGCPSSRLNAPPRALREAAPGEAHRTDGDSVPLGGTTAEGPRPFAGIDGNEQASRPGAAGVLRRTWRAAGQPGRRKRG
jgi:hypothetical protein